MTSSATAIARFLRKISSSTVPTSGIMISGRTVLPFFLHLDGGLDDRPDLHVADLGELDRQAAAAEAEHRVGLVELLDAALDLLDGDAELAGDLGLAGLVVGQELVQRRVEQADGHRQAVHRLEDADEVLLLEGLERGEGRLPALLVVGEDHLPHGDDPLAVEEHVLGAAEADPLGAERAGLGGVRGRVGVGADLERPDLVGPGHQRRRSRRRSSGSTVGTLPIMTSPVVPLIVTKSPALTTWPLMVIWPVFSSIGDGVAADDAGLAPAAGDDRRVAGLAAGGGEDALGQVHAGDVLGAGLLADQEDRVVGMLLVRARRRPRPRGRPCPQAAPGLAAMPLATTAAFALGSSCGRSRWFRLSGLTRLSAVVSSISPSLTISTAIRTAADPGPLAGAGLEHVERAVLRP